MRLNRNLNPPGYFLLHLHAHLPYVRHPELDDPLEERWFQEAMIECYLPLISVIEGWLRDGIEFRLSMSFSPTLLAMMRDELLRSRFERRLYLLIELAEKEIIRTRSEPKLQRLAQMYWQRWKGAQKLWERHRGDIPSVFADFARTGKVELCACSATHALLPILRANPVAVDAQIKLGIEAHREAFGAEPRGMWNAECGYYLGLEEPLKHAGIQYFFVDAHGLLHADHAPACGVFAPVSCPNGVRVFGRDLESSRTVWSAEEGFPGDGRYREFYRDLGYDLDESLIAPYIDPSGARTFTGIKYHRVTGRDVPLGEKELYDPEVAGALAVVHAENFAANRKRQGSYLSGLMSERPPLIFTPFDAELFGHWWFEGPQFLDRLMRVFDADSEGVKPITVTEYLARHSSVQTLMPSESSWGERGYAGMWIDESNDWIYPQLHRATDRMISAARHFARAAAPITRRTLNQMARQLLLAQASDWPFLIKSGTAASYATKRVSEHLKEFERGWKCLSEAEVDATWLERTEKQYPIFPKIDFSIFNDGE